ncbi:succinylglutamate desuccinylase/aspartoacylase family protein [Candidatus Poribacteria bacterium]|nr:succinylglutamate desuccinylase/aspartoacylase family protein [Candidatus Poribacteria bacterium]
MKVRSYQDVLDRILTAIGKSPHLTICHHSNSTTTPSSSLPYPLYCIQYTSKQPNSSLIYISAGIHGDEPAGVECAIRLIEQLSDKKRYKYWDSLLDRFNWMISPCDNPYGYERNIRENADGLDLNRMFETPQHTKETEFIADSLNHISIPKHISREKGSKRLAITVALDLHEDMDSDGFYLWERRRSYHTPIGDVIVNKVNTVCSINRTSKIEGHYNQNGVITLLDQITSKGWTRGRYLAEYEDTSCLILETPTWVDWNSRIKAHMMAIQAAIDMFANPM